MKREEKNLQSRQRIIAAARKEFGKKNYAEASLNTICSTGDISKGIIYHYFKDKDELYLLCVRECFNQLTRFLNQDYDFTCVQTGINKYITARYEFFMQYPDYCHIFCGAVFQPPAHLLTKIKEIRKDFDAQGSQFFKTALKHIKLMGNLTDEDAMEYFYFIQEMFNGYFVSTTYNDTDFTSLIKSHETKLSKLLNMMLYGITKEETKL